jgi:hypothetical protein
MSDKLFRRLLTKFDAEVAKFKTCPGYKGVFDLTHLRGDILKVGIDLWLLGAITSREEWYLTHYMDKTFRDMGIFDPHENGCKCVECSEDGYKETDQWYKRVMGKEA